MTAEQIVERALKITGEESSEKIAKGWSVLFGIDITGKQVLQAMVWFKLVRENHRHKDDNNIDKEPHIKPKIDIGAKVCVFVDSHSKGEYGIIVGYSIDYSAKEKILYRVIYESGITRFLPEVSFLVLNLTGTPLFEEEKEVLDKIKAMSLTIELVNSARAIQKDGENV